MTPTKHWNGSKVRSPILTCHQTWTILRSGDNAGGNIVHHVALRAAGKDLGQIKLKGVVVIQGFFGGGERTTMELCLKNVPIVSVESLD